MSGIIGWAIGKIKWLLLIAAVGGPVIAYMSWADGERVKHVAAQGIETQASIESATRTKRRRGGTSYAVDLAWKDAKGEERKAEKVAVSLGFANQIIRAEKIVADTVWIKYLPDEPGKDAVILRDDAEAQANTDQELIYVGAGAGVVGIIGSALFFLSGRRRKDEQVA
ncbi:hypothetical protein J2Y55_001678 [Bosea sp. BE125]|uniref:DUF3592 domain-containing protein n=1 Tax=Bosea sp. BE125 TaxID=2817909 RepID=UPI0028605640|nr:DUF3592 domain-containing protein [Bosea sp. BE125]MDR6870678.1 hypothetical protein [Bosea sp. BE125]